jgi:hypothetical protein
MTKRRLLSIALAIISIITVIALCSIRPINADNDEGGNQWEYLVVAGGQTNFAPATNSSLRKESSGSFSREQYPLEKNLDKLGAKGWELISVTGNASDPVYYFKRHK